jgi:hypothetical protein
VINAAFVDAGVATWDDPNMTLNPGEASFILNPSTNKFTVTFVGEVPQSGSGSSLTNPVPLVKGFSLVASQVPQSAILNGTNGLSFPAADGDTVYFFRNKTYVITAFVADPTLPGGGVWDAGDAIPNVGEGFFVSKNVATTWTRQFSVNP